MLTILRNTRYMKILILCSTKRLLDVTNCHNNPSYLVVPTKHYGSDCESSANIPNIKFNNGIECPVVGLGTWKSAPNVVGEAVKCAIDLGYRHFDCAYVYKNEKEVGSALVSKLKEKVVQREDLFIASKLWNTFHNPKLVKPAIHSTLEDLGLDYLDLYLIHWPVAFKEGKSSYPKNESGEVMFADIEPEDTWKAMEELVHCGLTKSIGVSNFNSAQVDHIFSESKIRPVVNQVEVHPYLNQRKLIDHCKKKDIAITAYGPLGSPDRPWAKPGDIRVLDDPAIKCMASRYNKTVAQVVLRYHIERGCIVIPKSSNRERIKENLDIFSFSLTLEDVSSLDALDRNMRMVAERQAEGHKHYPFHLEY